MGTYGLLACDAKEVYLQKHSKCSLELYNPWLSTPMECFRPTERNSIFA